MHRRFWYESLVERSQLEGLNMNGRIILKSILKRNTDWRLWAGFIWLRIGASEGSCEHGYEPSDSIKY
jgi:hypothetical protein